MDTKTMIRELESVEEKHKHDKVFTGQINIATMAHDVRKRLEELKPYEDTGLTPEKIMKLKEHMNDGWIPVEERLPEEAGTYIINALTGERNIVTFAKWQNRYKRFDMTGARSYWKIIAWRPLPEPYQAKEDDLHEKMLKRFERRETP